MCGIVGYVGSKGATTLLIEGLKRLEYRGYDSAGIAMSNGHGLETCYAHMSGFAVFSGQTVVRGQVIGYVGMSGRTTGAHLHYEVRIRSTPVNPHKYLRATLASPGTDVAAGS